MQSDQRERRVYNFSAGPGELPKEVLRQAQAEMMDWNGTGHSVMEMSHRSTHFIQIAEKAREDLRTFLEVPENFTIQFLQGGATNQFSSICFNLLGSDPEAKGNYLNTGYWTERAMGEAAKFSQPHQVASNKDVDYRTCKEASEWNIDPSGRYFHYCDNETIHGLEYMEDFPFDKVPEGMTIVCDMSSSIGTKRVNWNRVGVVYAGASKNLGPAGLTVVIVRNDLIPNPRPATPFLLDWEVYAKAQTMFMNTPPCWTIYVCGLNFQHMIKNGGLDRYIAEAGEKSRLFYEYIDSTDGFYSNDVDPKYRSRVNIPFHVCQNAEIEAKFAKDAAEADLIDLKGHPLVGACRASFYSPMPVEGVQKLIAFMKTWREQNPQQ